jgi:hypothetical protein
VAGLPISNAAVPACSQTGEIPAAVASDPDPAVAPKALHVRIDGGSEQLVATTGNPGLATIAVPRGSHALEFWGEDTVGGQESPHHTMTVVVGCPSAPLITAAPLISAAHLSSSTFRAASQGGSLARKRPPVGTTISYRDSQTATTTFTVLRPVAGHKKGSRCLAGAPRKRQKRCTRDISVGSFTHADTAGDVRVHFTGRVRGRKLKPGSYRLTLNPKANGKTGRTLTLAFRIVS